MSPRPSTNVNQELLERQRFSHKLLDVRSLPGSSPHETQMWASFPKTPLG
ncbi:hypothetical protein AVEN_93111-1, partial [Araneus ventricosus]